MRIIGYTVKRLSIFSQTRQTTSVVHLSSRLASVPGSTCRVAEGSQGHKHGGVKQKIELTDSVSFCSELFCSYRTEQF